jgi:hypothetical protein
MMEVLHEINKSDVAQVSTTINALIANSLQNPLFVDNLVAFLEHSVSVSNFPSPDSKLMLIKTLDMMSRYREKLEIEKGNLNMADLIKTAERFGPKAQSAFDGDIVVSTTV